MNGEQALAYARIRKSAGESDFTRAGRQQQVLLALRDRIVQGGFLAAFADSSMGASALTFARERKVFAANAEMKVSFLKPVPIGTTLTCTAYVLSGGNKAVFVEADVVDEDGRLVLKASSTYLLWARDGS